MSPDPNDEERQLEAMRLVAERWGRMIGDTFAREMLHAANTATCEQLTDEEQRLARQVLDRVRQAKAQQYNTGRDLIVTIRLDHMRVL